MSDPTPTAADLEQAESIGASLAYDPVCLDLRDSKSHDAFVDFVARALAAAAETARRETREFTDKEIRDKWAEIVKLNRPPGCVIDSGMFAIELVRWAIAAAIRGAGSE